MEKLAKNKTAPGRYALLDELRGLDLVSMMLYHACWDLVFLFDVEMKWYAATPGHLWQQSICWVFILLSGFWVLVTAVTLLFMPEERVIFGVLTFLGAAMLLTGILEPLLQKVPPAAGLVVSAVLFALCYSVSSGWVGVGSWKLLLPQGLYANYLTAFFGFYPEGFFSTDYFALLPWIFLFWAGYFGHRSIGRARMEALRGSVCAPLGWMGRHSLVLYLLHQPVIFGVLWAIFQIFH